MLQSATGGIGKTILFKVGFEADQKSRAVLDRMKRDAERLQAAISPVKLPVSPTAHDALASARPVADLAAKLRDSERERLAIIEKQNSALAAQDLAYARLADRARELGRLESHRGKTQISNAGAVSGSSQAPASSPIDSTTHARRETASRLAGIGRVHSASVASTARLHADNLRTITIETQARLVALGQVRSRLSMLGEGLASLATGAALLGVDDERLAKSIETLARVQGAVLLTKGGVNLLTGAFGQNAVAAGSTAAAWAGAGIAIAGLGVALIDSTDAMAKGSRQGTIDLGELNSVTMFTIRNIAALQELLGAGVSPFPGLDESVALLDRMKLASGQVLAAERARIDLAKASTIRERAALLPTKERNAAFESRLELHGFLPEAAAVGELQARAEVLRNELRRLKAEAAAGPLTAVGREALAQIEVVQQKERELAEQLIHAEERRQSTARRGAEERLRAAEREFDLVREAALAGRSRIEDDAVRFAQMTINDRILAAEGKAKLDRGEQLTRRESEAVRGFSTLADQVKQRDLALAEQLGFSQMFAPQIQQWRQAQAAADRQANVVAEMQGALDVNVTADSRAITQMVKALLEANRATLQDMVAQSMVDAVQQALARDRAERRNIIGGGGFFGQ